MAKDSSALTRVDELHANNNQNNNANFNRNNVGQDNDDRNGSAQTDSRKSSDRTDRSCESARTDGHYGSETKNSNTKVKPSLNDLTSDGAGGNSKEFVSDNTDLKKRVRALINNQEIGAETRSILKYGLEIDDPVLEELVCMVERGDSLDFDLTEIQLNSSDESITTHRSRNDPMKSERVAERSDASVDRHDHPHDYSRDYSIEYELAERESRLDQRDDFPDDSDYLATEAGNGNGGGPVTGNVCSSFDDEPEPTGRFSDCESFALFEHGLIEDPLDEEEVDEKLRKFISLICRAGNEPDIKSAALLSLLATLWYAPDFVRSARQLAFLQCCELDLYGIVSSQIEMIEQELMATEGA